MTHRTHDVPRAETLLGLLRAFRDDHTEGTPIRTALDEACAAYDRAVEVIHAEHQHQSPLASLRTQDAAA